MLRVLYVCRGVDDGDPITGVQATWIRTLAAHPDVEHVDVLARHAGRVDVPANVVMHTFGRGRGSKRRFVREVARVRPRPNVFLVTQGGPWPLLLLPFKWLGRRRLYHWLAQPVLSRPTRAAIAIADTALFTATAGSLPRVATPVHVVGHGIDVDRFRPSEGGPFRDMVVAGRISRAKGIEQMIVAFASAIEQHGIEGNLDVIGTIGQSHRPHKEVLDATAARLGVAERVRFLGPVPYDEMPATIARYRLALNFSTNALDKTVVEAMAAGVPVLATNPCVREILPDDLSARLVVGPDDTHGQARAMAALLALEGDDRLTLSSRLRAIAVDGHSVQHLFDEIVRQITKDGARARR